MNESEFNFEKAFSRLEEILDKMNSGKVTLDESLKLYEEADLLISKSSAKLHSVEERIETLIKKRNGELELDEEDKPLTETFLIS